MAGGRGKTGFPGSLATRKRFGQHLLHDPAVIAKIVDAYEGGDVSLTLVKDGDHRLSEPVDIDRLLRTVDELAG